MKHPKHSPVTRDVFKTRVRKDTPIVQVWCWDRPDDHRPICSHFGCGKVLCGTETLAGGKCFEHMKRVSVDASKHVNF